MDAIIMTENWSHHDKYLHELIKNLTEANYCTHTHIIIHTHTYAYTHMLTHVYAHTHSLMLRLMQSSTHIWIPGHSRAQLFKHEDLLKHGSSHQCHCYDTGLVTLKSTQFWEGSQWAY